MSPRCSRNKGSSPKDRWAFEIRPGFTGYRIAYVNACARRILQVRARCPGLNFRTTIIYARYCGSRGPLPTAIVADDTLLECVNVHRDSFSTCISRTIQVSSRFTLPPHFRLPRPKDKLQASPATRLHSHYIPISNAKEIFNSFEWPFNSGE